MEPGAFANEGACWKCGGQGQFTHDELGFRALQARGVIEPPPFTYEELVLRLRQAYGLAEPAAREVIPEILA